MGVHMAAGFKEGDIVMFTQNFKGKAKQGDTAFVERLWGVVQAVAEVKKADGTVIPEVPVGILVKK